MLTNNFKRFRRNRIHPHLRNMVNEFDVQIKDFIYPLFVKDGIDEKQEIESMPNIYQMSINDILTECEELATLGINSIILFGIPKNKDELGSECLSANSIISRTIKAIKKQIPNMFIITDLCFCEYTNHGHCGILNKNTTVDNDKTLELLNKQALVHLEAGVDMLAPSGMMDGVVYSLRNFMDKNGYTNTPIMSYSTKFASAYYGPFRDIAQSAPSFGDRQSYQMNGANKNEALLESIEDAQQGADILMVKPALAYLDIVSDIKQATKMPLAIYNVSGEYAMIKLASSKGYVDYNKIVMETMTSFKRAGADIIISYHAKDVAKILQKI